MSPSMRKGETGDCPLRCGRGTVPGRFLAQPQEGVLLSVFVDAGWSSPVARWAHNPKVAGSNPAPATMKARMLEIGAAAFSILGAGAGFELFSGNHGARGSCGAALPRPPRNQGHAEGRRADYDGSLPPQRNGRPELISRRRRLSLHRRLPKPNGVEDPSIGAGAGAKPEAMCKSLVLVVLHQRAGRA